MTKKPKPLLTAASIGRQFVRRDGTISGRLDWTPSEDTYPASDDVSCYTVAGNMWEHPLGNEHELDLIRLATPAEIAAGHALPVKERKTKEGRTYTHWAWEQRFTSGVHSVGICETREEAREVRAAQRLNKIKCGPIFRLAITCPAWSPK